MDSFYKSLTEKQKEIARENNYNFDHPDAFDFDLMFSALKDLKAGKSVEIPVYDFTTHSRIEETQVLYGASVVVFEGILSFYDKAVRDLMDLKIFVQTDADVRLARRLKRDIAERGRDMSGILEQYSKFVKPSFDDFIQPTVRYADVIVPNGLENQAAIKLLTEHVAKKLEEKGITANGGFKSCLRQIHKNKTNIPSHVTILKSRNSSSQNSIEELIKHLKTNCDFTGFNICEIAYNSTNSTQFSELISSSFPTVFHGKLMINIDPSNQDPILLSCELPKTSASFKFIILEDYISTGATAMMAIRVLLDHGVIEDSISLLSLKASLTGMNAIGHAFPNVSLICLEGE